VSIAYAQAWYEAFYHLSIYGKAFSFS